MPVMKFEISPVVGKKSVGLKDKKHHSSPQSSQSSPRKKNLINLCDLRVLCGEILLENGFEFHEVSYKATAIDFEP
jgi:hypothetical protein